MRVTIFVLFILYFENKICCETNVLWFTTPNFVLRSSQSPKQAFFKSDVNIYLWVSVEIFINCLTFLVIFVLKPYVIYVMHKLLSIPCNVTNPVVIHRVRYRFLFSNSDRNIMDRFRLRSSPTPYFERFEGFWTHLHVIPNKSGEIKYFFLNLRFVVSSIFFHTKPRSSYSRRKLIKPMRCSSYSTHLTSRFSGMRGRGCLYSCSIGAGRQSTRKSCYDFSAESCAGKCMHAIDGALFVFNFGELAPATGYTGIRGGMQDKRLKN